MDLAPDGAEGQVDQILGPVVEIEMGEFLEINEQVRVVQHVQGQVAVQVQFDPDHGIRADQAAHPFEQVAFAVVISLGDHGPVQTEQHAVHGQGGLKLAQDLIPQVFVCLAVDQAARFGPGGRAFDQFEPLGPGAPARGDNGAAAEGRRFGVLPGRSVKGFDKRIQIHGQGGKGIGFIGQGTRQRYAWVSPYAPASTL